MTSPQPIIDLSDVSVRIYERSLATSLKRRLLGRAHHDEVKAVTILDGLTLRVVPGDRVGVIGRNGAGKTSLMKLIAGIYPAASGIRHVEGDVAPVTSQNSGFSGELSLRRNIRLGLIHTGRHHWWSPEFESRVLEFAELADRADDPLKVLSSGNQARLAFALSLFQHPDILLLDEVFATGDFGFVDKARLAMLDRVTSTPITLFVSHDEHMIQQVCNRCIFLARGRLMADGPPVEVIRAYHRAVESGH